MGTKGTKGTKYTTRMPKRMLPRLGEVVASHFYIRQNELGIVLDPKAMRGSVRIVITGRPWCRSSCSLEFNEPNPQVIIRALRSFEPFKTNSFIALTGP
jgi:hypothetical protein